MLGLVAGVSQSPAAFAVLASARGGGPPTLTGLTEVDEAVGEEEELDVEELSLDLFLPAESRERKLWESALRNFRGEAVRGLFR